MTEPSKWAQELASHVFLCTLDRDTRRNIAFVLDAARRQALEEAAQIAIDGAAIAVASGPIQFSTPTEFACDLARDIADAIRALIDREPTP